MTRTIVLQDQPRRWTLAGIGLLALLGLLVIGMDQGQTLSTFQGSLAYDQNLIHEFLHDARHVAGFPCH